MKGWERSRGANSGIGSAESLGKRCLLFWIGCGLHVGKFMCKQEAEAAVLSRQERK